MLNSEEDAEFKVKMNNEKVVKRTILHAGNKELHVKQFFNTKNYPCVKGFSFHCITFLVFIKENSEDVATC